MNFQVTVHFAEISTAGSASFPVPDFFRNALGVAEAGVADFGGAVEDDEPELHAPNSASTSANVAADASILAGRRDSALVTTLLGLRFRPKREVIIGPTFCVISSAEQPKQ